MTTLSSLASSITTAGLLKLASPQPPRRYGASVPAPAARQLAGWGLNPDGSAKQSVPQYAPQSFAVRQQLAGARARFMPGSNGLASGSPSWGYPDPNRNPFALQSSRLRHQNEVARHQADQSFYTSTMQSKNAPRTGGFTFNGRPLDATLVGVNPDGTQRFRAPDGRERNFSVGSDGAVTPLGAAVPAVNTNMLGLKAQPSGSGMVLRDRSGNVIGSSRPAGPKPIAPAPKAKPGPITV